MLINALCDYYDILAKSGRVLPAGYSKVKIHYIVSLTPDGKIDDIIDAQNEVEAPTNKGKTKLTKVPKEVLMPLRTEKTSIDANIIEHRPLYLFGLNLVAGNLTPSDNTKKAEKSHNAFVKTTLDFLDGLDSPLIQAFRNFVKAWKPEEETDNAFLKGLGKKYAASGFAFCLTGSPDHLLHDEPALKEKWEQEYQNRTADKSDAKIAQCAVTGEMEPIARIHNKIKGVGGGQQTGNVLIGFKNNSVSSYGNEQSYNSNISEAAMQKYTEALNYLLSDKNHKIYMDDMTIVFWAMDSGESCEKLFLQMLQGQTDEMDAAQTEEMLKRLWEDSRRGKVLESRIQSLDGIQPDVDFYILALKPNQTRLAIKFILHNRYADILWNIAGFQRDIQIGSEVHAVPLTMIFRELLSPKSKDDKGNPALSSKIFESIIRGASYPVSLLETMVRRVKTDDGKIDTPKGKINRIRAGVIKACINRSSDKEELTVALDTDNHDQAYLCGRLFAVLERLQQDASNNALNRTIRDSYFASASTKPALVLPNLVRLAQNHLNKVKSPTYYKIIIGEIMDQFNGEFPDSLSLKEQGKFIVGYYQQYQRFFEKKEQVNNKEDQ